VKLNPCSEGSSPLLDSKREPGEVSDGFEARIERSWFPAALQLAVDAHVGGLADGSHGEVIRRTDLQRWRRLASSSIIRKTVCNARAYSFWSNPSTRAPRIPLQQLIQIAIHDCR